MEKLRIVPVDYGLGKYYTLTEKSGLKHPIIELNINMLYFNEDLFVWVFNHEIDHYLFYQNPKNSGKTDLFHEIVHSWPNKYNMKMLSQLRKFEKKYPGVYREGHKRFKLVEEKWKST